VSGFAFEITHCDFKFRRRLYKKRINGNLNVVPIDQEIL